MKGAKPAGKFSLGTALLAAKLAQAQSDLTKDGRVQMWMAVQRSGRREWVWVCFSEFFCSIASVESASTWLGA
jgi:hypothetical protein